MVSWVDFVDLPIASMSRSAKAIGIMVSSKHESYRMQATLDMALRKSHIDDPVRSVFRFLLPFLDSYSLEVLVPIDQI